jgi:hypothetical protein
LLNLPARASDGLLACQLDPGSRARGLEKGATNSAGKGGNVRKNAPDEDRGNTNLAMSRLFISDAVEFRLR